MAFKGFAREEKLLPKVSAVGKGAAKAFREWPQLLHALRAELDAIGRGFASGDARVDPKKGGATCGMCDQQMACRIAERAPFGAVGAGDVDE
jgi:ATP-dependent helicase/nuclease subunit B